MLDVVLGEETFKILEQTLKYVSDSIEYRYPHHLVTSYHDIRIELDNVPTLPISIKTTSILKAENTTGGTGSETAYLNKKLNKQKQEMTYISIILNEINELDYMYKYIIIYYYLESRKISFILKNLNISKSTFYKNKKEALMILSLYLPETCVFLKGGEEYDGRERSL